MDIGGNIEKGEMIALFRGTPARSFRPEDAAGRVASGSSVGTWTTLAMAGSRLAPRTSHALATPSAPRYSFLYGEPKAAGGLSRLEATESTATVTRYGREPKRKVRPRVALNWT